MGGCVGGGRGGGEADEERGRLRGEGGKEGGKGEEEGTYGGVVVGKGVVDGHIFEEPSDVGVEEAFDFFVVEFGVDENGADVGLDYIG